MLFNILKDTSERTWALQDNHWLPERSDHPLESTPTSWGLIEKKRTQTQFLQRQRTMPNLRYLHFFHFSSFFISSLVNIRVDIFVIDQKNILRQNLLVSHESIPQELLVQIL